jgi:AcrR family transcriptional regulator
MARVTTGGKQPRHNIRGATTRARVLDVALNAFAERGFHGASTRDIADAAGMSPGVVYAHFHSKEDLLYRLSLAGHSDVRDLVAAAVASSQDPVEQLRNVVFDFVVWNARFRTHARVVQYEMDALSPEHLAEIAAIRRQTQGDIREVILRGIDTEVFEVADVGSVARAITSLGIDVARWYDSTGRLNPRHIGDEYVDLALRMVGHPLSGRSSRGVPESAVKHEGPVPR